MNLPELIIKYNLKAGDDVVCTVSVKSCYVSGVKKLMEHNGRLAFYDGGLLWSGENGYFELPKPVNTFVNSQCKNTAENQKALFALGYSWADNLQVVQYLNAVLLQTGSDGSLGYLNTSDWVSNLPELYEFTTIATLKPKSEKQIEIECIECEIEKLMDRLNNLKGSE